jgi:DNA polymerase-3 subunit epsilon
MKILIFDTETTGRPKNSDAPIHDLNNWPRLVQLAWQVYDSEQNLTKEHDFIIEPNGFSIPIEASNINNITTDKAKEVGVDINFVLGLFCQSINEVDLLVAHNYSFDYGVIASELFRNGFENVLKLKGHVCTMKSSTEFCQISGPNGYKWPTLEKLYAVLFNEACKVHNALDDVKATAKCFWALVDKGIIKSNLIENKTKREDKVNKGVGNLFKKTLEYYENSEYSIRPISSLFVELIYKKCDDLFENNEKAININNARKLEYLIYCVYYVEKALKKNQGYNKLRPQNIFYAGKYIDTITVDILLDKELFSFLFNSIKVTLIDLGHSRTDKEIAEIIKTRYSSYKEYDIQFLESIEDGSGQLMNSAVYNYVFLNRNPLEITVNSKIDRNLLRAYMNQYPLLYELTSLFELLGFPENYIWVTDTFIRHHG